MSGAIDTLADLIECLDAAAGPDRKSIVLGGSLFDAAGTLAGYLGPATTEFTVTASDAALIQTATECVRIVGTSSLFEGVPYSVTVTGTVPSPGVVVLVMSMTPAEANWTFRSNFPAAADYFPGFRGFDPQLRRMADLPSIFNDLRISAATAGAPIFWAATAGTVPPAGLSIDAVLDVTGGSLAPYLGDFLPAAAALPLKGSLRWTAGFTFPIIAFEAGLALDLPTLDGPSLRLTAGPLADEPLPVSDAALAGTVSIGGRVQSVRASVLQGPYLWIVDGSISGVPLDKGIGDLVSFVGGTDLTVPDGLLSIGGFELTAAQVGLVPQKGTIPALDSLGVTISSPRSWQLPLTGLAISDVAVNWSVLHPLRGPVLTGAVTGHLYFGPSGDPSTPRLGVRVGLTGLSGPSASSVSLEAALDADPKRSLTLAQLFDSLTGLDIGIGESVTVTALDLLASTQPRNYFFYAELENSWQPIPQLQLNEMNFGFQYSGGSWTASIGAKVEFLTLPFLLCAEYRGAGQGWRFAGGLVPTGTGYKLGDFVCALLPSGWVDPATFPNIALTGLSAWFDSLSKESGFAAAVQWSETFFGSYTLVADASFSLQHLKDPATGKLAYSGFLAGQLQLNALSVGVQYNFGVATQPQGGRAAAEAQYQFTIAYRGATLTAALSKNAAKQDILSVNLGGVSFGDILGFLVDLADPGANYRLPSPWDALYGVTLDGLTLTVNTSTREVGVRYALGLELGFARIDTIGLTYRDKAGRSGVDFAVTGRFGAEEYPAASPLAWDVLNDPPPTPAGKGEALLDLRFMGLGQNVGFAKPAGYGSVPAVISAMEAGFAPAGATGPSPLAGNDALIFTGDGRWLIGADFTVASTVSLQFVFNDPALYGLRVALAGEKAKKLAGLDFEILYKKVTATIGVYHIDLTLPSAMRQFEFGAVSITLPTISVDIYTNGNFFIDCGFPTNMDFSKSACVQAATFTGYGGFYFGVLDGATSNQVPAITNGTFSPVIEVGLALSVGIGRTFDKGVIQAGLTVSIEGALEGVFGWFEPTDRSLPSALYHRVVGTIELRGHLYGVADFVVISARIDVLAFARLTLTIESYQPILVEVDVGVEVEVSMKIVFFTVHFGFSETLHFSFTIGSASQTPWIVAAGAPPALQLAQQRRGTWRPRTSGAAHHRRLLRGLGEAGDFDWSRMPQPETPAPVPLSAVLGLTLSDESPAGPTAPALQAVLSLFVENSIPPTASRAAEIRAVEMDEPEQAPFNLIAAGMLRWALEAYRRPGDPDGPSTYAMVSDLDAILDFLADKTQWRAAFDDNLYTFLARNFRLEISSPQAAGASAPAGASGAPPSVCIFPIIPALSMTGPVGAVSFATQGLIGPSYEDALEAYYAQLAQTTPGSGPRGAAEAGFADPCAATDPESLSRYIFRDYFAIVAKGVANSARSMLKAYPYPPTGASLASAPARPETLASIAALFPGPPLVYDAHGWESLAIIGGRLGVPVDELRTVNAGLARHGDHQPLRRGTPVLVPTGASPRSIVGANPDYPLQWGMSGPSGLPLDGVHHQVGAPAPTGLSESIATIAGSYGLAPATLFSGPTGATNAANPQLLAPGATLMIPSAQWDSNSGLSLDVPPLAAGFFAARALPPASPADGQWYELVSYISQYIYANNASLTGATWAAPIMGWTGATGASGPSGSTPVVLGATGYAVQGATIAGPSAPARDTPELAAAAIALAQLAPEPQADVYRPILRGIVSGPSGLVTPAFAAAPPVGASFGGLGARFGFDPADLATANQERQGVLRPLSVLALPTVTHIPQSGDTLGSVAANFDLTADQLADSLAMVPRLLQPWAPGATMLTIPDLPGHNTADLVGDLATTGRFNDVSGMVSRFLMHGMRVPRPATGPVEPFPAEVPMGPIYGFDGQQFAVPTGPCGATGFSVQLASGATWAIFSPPSPTGPTATLELEIDSAFIAANSPAPVLDPNYLAGPSALPLYRDQPRHYPLRQAIHWQAASPVGPTGISPPAAGQPSLWPFSPPMQAIASAGATGNPGSAWSLYMAAAGAPPGASAAPVGSFAWGSAVTLRLRRVRDDAGAPVPNVYLLMGSDEEGKELLLQLWQSIGDSGNQLFIAYPPAVDSNNPQGLASDAVDLDRTVILKAGLSTVTHSGSARFAAEPATGRYFATAAAARSFAKLAWEASVTAQGGFYLLYRTAAGGDLPAAIFGGSDDVSVRMIVLAQSQLAWGGQPLMPFNNVAVVTENIPAHATVFGRPMDPAAGLYRAAAVPPGNAGFYLIRPNPAVAASVTAPTPAALTQSLFHLAGAQIAGNDDFFASNRATPIGPLGNGNSGLPGPTGPDLWRYRGLYPVYRFGKANSCPASDALPAADENPYRGIGGSTGSGGAQAEFALAFYDVYGNQAQVEGGLPNVLAPVGYTDEIIGVTTWPGAGASYAFRAADAGKILLETVLSLQPGRYAPAAGYDFAQASEAAAADAARYATIFYQVQQADYRFSVTTNLGSLPADPLVLKASFSAFVTKALVYCRAAGTQQQCTLVTEAGNTLPGLAGTWRVDARDLVRENKDQLLSPLFPGPLVVPKIVAAAPSRTLNDYAGTALMPVGGTFPPRCAIGEAPRRRGGGLRMAEAADLSGRDEPAPPPKVTSVEVATWNEAVPLSPGLALKVSPTTLRLNAPASLQDAAGLLNAAAYAAIPGANGTEQAIGLYFDNKDDPIINAGIALDVNGRKTVTLSEDSFAKILERVTPPGGVLSDADFVAQVRGVADLIAGGPIRSGSFVVPAPQPGATPSFSLRDVPSGTVEDIAADNQWTGGFFLPGQPLYLGYSCRTPGPGDTFASLSAEENVPIEALAVWNGGSVSQGVTLNVPALTRIGAGASAYAAYSPLPEDSLDSAAAALGLGEAGYKTIAALTGELAGIFADGAVVSGPTGATAAAGPADSMQSIAVKLGTSLDGLVEQIHGTTGLYRPGGALLGPLPHVPGADYAPPLETLAGAFNLAGPNGLSASAMLLDANRSLDGFLRVGATWAGPSGAKPLTVAPHDSVATVLAAFQAGTTAPFGVGDLAAANAGMTALLTVGATFLVPPGPNVVRLELAPRIPPAGLSGPDAIAFPVAVGIGATRNPAWVNPDFVGPSGATAVYEVTAAIGPEGATLPAGPAGLAAFAAEFEAAFVGQRLRCAVSEDGSAASDAKIWALNLGPSGASGIAVEAATPAFYALAPLSTTLVGGTASVRPYESGSPLGASGPMAFNAIDLDAWMLTFATAVDMVLGPQYAAAAFAAGAGAAPRREEGPRGLQSPPTQAGLGATGGGGRDAFDRIVAAKQAAARGLSRQVMPILSGVGAESGAGLAAAQDTLYQRMEERLSDAYSISAVVQYPVALASPCAPTGGPGPYPPRLSGRVEPDLYVVPPGAAGTLALAAAAFSVSAPHLGMTLADVRALLAPGAKATWLAKEHVVAPGDTLRSLASILGADLADWRGRTDFFEALSGQPLLTAGFAIPAVAVCRAVQPGENAAALAAFFAVPVTDMLEANETATGLFAPGAVITVDGKPHPVARGDTLLGIATSESWTMAQIADSVLPSLMPQATFFLAPPLPELDLATAKIELSSDGAGETFLSFALALKRPERHRNVFLNLKYVATEVERDIFDVAGGQDYQSSSWLSLTRPLGDTLADPAVRLAMQQVQVPIPLHFYPVAPSLIGQAGTPSAIVATSPAEQIRQAREWDYSFDLRTDNASQDTTHLDLLFNAGPNSAAMAERLRGNAGAAPAGLFGALAQFVFVWPALAPDLARLIDPTCGAADPIAAQAVAVFAELCGGVRAAFESGLTRFDALDDGAERYRYRMVAEGEGGTLSDLRLVNEEGATGPWPDIWVQVPDAATGPTRFQPLTMSAPAGATARYGYPPQVPAEAPLIHRFAFRGRDVLSNLNGWGGAWLSRNDDLIASGPLGAGSGPHPPPSISVSPQFVYATPTVRFVEPLTPFLGRGQSIDVAGLTAPNPPPDRSVEQHLENLLSAVLATPAGPTAAMLSALVSYGFPVTPVGPTASAPVLMLPAQVVGPNVGVVAQTLGAGLRNWHAAGGAAGPSGTMTVDLILFAQPVGASGDKPLLEIEQLEIPLESIDWNKG